MSTWQPLWVLYFVVLPLLGVAGLVLLVRGIRDRLAAPFSGKSPEPYIRAFVIALILLALIVAALKIIPAITADSGWNPKQQRCALEAGYASPADNTSGYATDSSRQVYQACLNR